MGQPATRAFTSTSGMPGVGVSISVSFNPRSRGCGPSAVDDGAATSAPDLRVEDVVPGLEFLGNLAAMHLPVVTVTFDSGSATLELADGASLDVPEGAFDGPTELRAAIVDIELGTAVLNPPQARIYVISTAKVAR